MRNFYNYLLTDESLDSTRLLENITSNLEAMFTPFPRYNGRNSITPLDVPTKEELLRNFRGDTRDTMREAFERPSGKFLVQPSTRYLFSTISETFNKNISPLMFQDLMEDNCRKYDANRDLEKFVAKELYAADQLERFCSYNYSLSSQHYLSEPRIMQDDWFSLGNVQLYSGQGGYSELGYIVMRASRFPIINPLNQMFSLYPIAQMQITENCSKRNERTSIVYSGIPHLNTEFKAFEDDYTILGNFRDINVHYGFLAKQLINEYGTTYEPYRSFIE